MENATKRIRRMRRQGSPGTHAVSARVFGAERKEHYVVTLDRGRLRIYRENNVIAQPGVPGLQLVESIDFPEGFDGFTDRESDAAGRFPGSRGTTAGMSIDERLPMQREHERRRANDLAAELDRFLTNRPRATWDLAAPPTICRAVLGRLSAQTRRRLQHSVAKDLTKHPARDLNSISSAA